MARVGVDGADDFAEWVASRGASLQRFAYLLTGSASDAPDLVQEALAAAYPRWASLARRGTAEAYVRRSIVNASISAWRKGRRLVSVADTEAVMPTIGDPAEAAPDADQAWRLCRQEPDGTRELDGWTRIIRTIGQARITVLSDRDHLAVARRILDSAKQVTRDQFGCDATSPVQRGHFPSPPKPFDLGQVDRVDSIAVCQYRLHTPVDHPALLASRQLTGAAAQDELEALKAAPVGGGPNTPETCLNSETGDMAIVLRLDTGTEVHDVYGYMDWCINNGFDDGTHVRELTRPDCLPIWSGRVLLLSGDSTPFERCHQD